MSQVVIVEKFVRYLGITSEQYVFALNAELEAIEQRSGLQSDHPPLVEILALEARAQTIQRLCQEHKAYIGQFQLDLRSEGFCLGFGLCHGAMELAGKLNWWQHVLVTLYHWDGSPDVLDEIVSLPDVEAGREKTLRELFELAINFVIYHQVRIHEEPYAYQAFIPSGMSQATILWPSNSDDLHKRQGYFEMLDQQGEIQTVQQYYPIVGYFTEKELKSMLTPALLRDAICLIASTADIKGKGHLVRISYNSRGNLKIYDANFEHNSADNLYREYLIDEGMALLLQRLGTQSLGIQLVALTQRERFVSEEYEERINQLDVSLMQKKGLSLLISHIPGFFDCVLEEASVASPEKDAIRNALANMLRQKDNSQSGLHFLFQYRPALVGKVIELALMISDPDKLAMSFADVVIALLIKNESGQTGWDTIEKYSYQKSREIQQLFNLKLLNFSSANLERMSDWLVSVSASQAAAAGFFSSPLQRFLHQLQERVKMVCDICVVNVQCGVD